LREYQTTFIIQPEITDEGIQAICGRLEGVLEKQGATRLFYDDMGRRRLAYEIKKFQKGQYLTLFFLDDGKSVPELERALRLDDSILRFLTVMANPEVADIEARKAEAVELEKVRAEKAAEKAAREAEEEAARAAEEAERAAAAAAAAAAAPPPAEEPVAESPEEAPPSDAQSQEEAPPSDTESPEDAPPSDTQSQEDAPEPAPKADTKPAREEG
jgi:small subunit ribosomal protein S6